MHDLRVKYKKNIAQPGTRKHHTSRLQVLYLCFALLLCLFNVNASAAVNQCCYIFKGIKPSSDLKLVMIEELGEYNSIRLSALYKKSGKDQWSLVNTCLCEIDLATGYYVSSPQMNLHASPQSLPLKEDVLISDFWLHVSLNKLPESDFLFFPEALMVSADKLGSGIHVKLGDDRWHGTNGIKVYQRGRGMIAAFEKKRSSKKAQLLIQHPATAVTRLIVRDHHKLFTLPFSDSKHADYIKVKKGWSPENEGYTAFSSTLAHDIPLALHKH
ncbi:hypothetical protein ACWJJH_05535 [Endozoicomonadaceae bacterium StTr2]